MRRLRASLLVRGREGRASERPCGKHIPPYSRLELRSSQVERLFVANAPKYLPPEVAAKGLKIHRIGHGVVRHARL